MRYRSRSVDKDGVFAIVLLCRQAGIKIKRHGRSMRRLKGERVKKEEQEKKEHKRRGVAA
jgi:hypothetical protein